MEVTSDNFSTAVEILKTSLDKADFVAIDGEFTGLSTLKKRSYWNYDTLEENYSKLRRGSSEFLLIQYGVCLFTWNDESNNYEATSFTFYIYPRPYKRNFNDVMFMCQSSSIDFLVKNGFDFNKVFYKGISFMSPWEEERARARLKKGLSFCSAKAIPVISKISNSPGEENKSKVFIPKNQRDFINEISETVSQFLKDDTKQSVHLPPCNPFQRKLIYESLEEKYPMGLYLESMTNEKAEKFISVVKVTAAGLDERSSAKYKAELQILDDVVGFTKVMRMLSDSKKPIIGHNMLMDLFLTTNNFFAKTPENLEEFKSLIVTLFPVIFDTKLISSTQPLKEKIPHTSLKGLMNCVVDEILPTPNVVMSTKLIDYSESKSDYHQAGYDAYCTGCSFISLSKCLLMGLNIPCSRIDISSEILMPFVNRVNIMGIRDIQYVDLGGRDRIPERKNVFQIQFPMGWNERDLENVFSPICTLSHPTVWLDETSAYVTLSRTDKRDEVIEKLVLQQKSNGFFVYPYKHPAVNGNSVKRHLDEEVQVVVPKRKKADSEIEDGELSSDDNGDCVEEKLFGLPQSW